MTRVNTPDSRVAQIAADLADAERRERDAAHHLQGAETAHQAVLRRIFDGENLADFRDRLRGELQVAREAHADARDLQTLHTAELAHAKEQETLAAEAAKMAERQPFRDAATAGLDGAFEALAAFATHFDAARIAALALTNKYGEHQPYLDVMETANRLRNTVDLWVRYREGALTIPSDPRR